MFVKKNKNFRRRPEDGEKEEIIGAEDKKSSAPLLSRAKSTPGTSGSVGKATKPNPDSKVKPKSPLGPILLSFGEEEQPLPTLKSSKSRKGGADGSGFKPQGSGSSQSLRPGSSRAGGSDAQPATPSGFQATAGEYTKEKLAELAVSPPFLIRSMASIMSSSSSIVDQISIPIFRHRYSVTCVSLPLEGCRLDVPEKHSEDRGIKTEDTR